MNSQSHILSSLISLLLLFLNVFNSEVRYKLMKQIIGFQTTYDLLIIFPNLSAIELDSWSDL